MNRCSVAAVSALPSSVPCNVIAGGDAFETKDGGVAFEGNRNNLSTEVELRAMDGLK
jgi:hypothetical protein